MTRAEKATLKAQLAQYKAEAETLRAGMHSLIAYCNSDKYEGVLAAMNPQDVVLRCGETLRSANHEGLTANLVSQLRSEQAVLCARRHKASMGGTSTLAMNEWLTTEIDRYSDRIDAVLGS